MIVVPFNADYAQTLLRWYYAPELKPYFRGYIHGVNLKQMIEAPRVLGAHILLGISEGQAVGMMTFADVDPIIRIYRAGLLVDPAYQQQNVGREISEKALKWAFDTMNAHKVYGEFLERDFRLMRGAPLQGFTQEGIKRESCFFEGEYHNEVVVSLLQSEYRRMNVHTDAK